MAGSHSAGMRMPRFGSVTPGRHRDESGRAKRTRDGSDMPSSYGPAGYEPQHATRQRHNPQHRATTPDRPTRPARGRHRRGDDTPDVWVPTRDEWHRLAAGETVNGHRLDVPPPGYKGRRRRG